MFQYYFILLFILSYLLLFNLYSLLLTLNVSVVSSSELRKSFILNYLFITLIVLFYFSCWLFYYSNYVFYYLDLMPSRFCHNSLELCSKFVLGFLEVRRSYVEALVVCWSYIGGKILVVERIDWWNKIIVR